jgi:Na+-driven multidrug efflux pump
MHIVALGQGIRLTSEATIATTFPHVVFRPTAGDSDVLPFSGVWLLCNSNQALRRFISLARTLSKTWKAPNEAAVDGAHEAGRPH